MLGNRIPMPFLHSHCLRPCNSCTISCDPKAYSALKSLIRTMIPSQKVEESEIHCKKELKSLWWDTTNTLEREPCGDGSPPGAQTKGFSAARGTFCSHPARTPLEGNTTAHVILMGWTRIVSSRICCLWRVFEGQTWEWAQMCHPGVGVFRASTVHGSTGMKRMGVTPTVSLFSAAHRWMNLMRRKQSSYVNCPSPCLPWFSLLKDSLFIRSQVC